MPNRAKPTPANILATRRSEQAEQRAQQDGSSAARTAGFGGRERSVSYSSADILALQRTLGNQAVGRLLMTRAQRQPNGPETSHGLTTAASTPQLVIQRVWNQPGGAYKIKEKCTLREDDEDYTEIEKIEAGSLVQVANQPLEKEFRLHIFKENHIWVAHNLNEGWVRENAIGGRDPSSAVDTYTGDKIRNLPHGRFGMQHPDLNRYISMNPRLKLFVAGVDTTESSMKAVKKIVTNIIDNDLFHYTGNYTSQLNFMSGSSNGGDCRTLSESIYTIMTNVLQMGGVNVQSKLIPFRANHQKPTLDGTAANQGDHWEFDNHYWLDVGGTHYDVLFNANLDQSRWQDL